MLVQPPFAVEPRTGMRDVLAPVPCPLLARFLRGNGSEDRLDQGLVRFQFLPCEFFRSFPDFAWIYLPERLKGRDRGLDRGRDGGAVPCPLSRSRISVNRSTICRTSSRPIRRHLTGPCPDRAPTLPAPVLARSVPGADCPAPMARTIIKPTTTISRGQKPSFDTDVCPSFLEPCHECTRSERPFTFVQWLAHSAGS